MFLHLSEEETKISQKSLNKKRNSDSEKNF